MINRKSSVVLWHGALTVVHRRVALAAFLRQAREDAVRVYYNPRDPAARDVRAAARAVGVILRKAPPSAGDPPGAWGWIGTHGVPPMCDLVRGSSMPPLVILCLSMPPPTGSPPPVPCGHRVYVTDTPWS